MTLSKHWASLSWTSVQSQGSWMMGCVAQGHNCLNRIHVSTYSLSSTVRTVRCAGHPHCQPHNQIISVQHCRHCRPIDPNATPKLVLLSSRTHPIHRYKDHTLVVYVEGLGGGHISERGSEFLLYHCTLWVSHSKSRIPYDCSHSSFQWPDASQIKSTLLCNDNKRSLLISHAVYGAAVWRMLLSQWWRQTES